MDGFTRSEAFWCSDMGCFQVRLQCSLVLAWWKHLCTTTDCHGLGTDVMSGVPLHSNFCTAPERPQRHHD